MSEFLTEDGIRVLKVGSGTSHKDLGKSIFATFTKENQEQMILRSVGAGAVNQALKAIVGANSLLSPRGRVCNIRVSYAEVSGRDGDSMTALELHITLSKI